MGEKGLFLYVYYDAKSVASEYVVSAPLSVFNAGNTQLSWMRNLYGKPLGHLFPSMSFCCIVVPKFAFCIAESQHILSK